MNSFSKIIKNIPLYFKKDRQFKNPLFFVIILLQLLIFIFGIIFNGSGNAQDFEMRAKLYTRYNNSYGQTYSLIVPPNQSTSMNYLKDHIRGVERDPVLVKNNCKLFYVNRNLNEKALSPFVLDFKGYNLNMSIVYTVDTIDPCSYFGLETLYGDSKISDSGQILLPLQTAINVVEQTNLSDVEDLVDSTIFDSNSEKEYLVVGVFKDKTNLLNKFVSDNYLIGFFDDFSKNNINHSLAFTTGKSYLENLFFLYRINTYINPPNYNRTTIVSTEGNDFDSGGNSELTNTIYGFEVKTQNRFFSWTFYISFLLVNALTAFMSASKKINKFGLIVVGCSFFLFLSFFSFVGFLIDLNIFNTMNLCLNMVTGTTVFVISLITFIIDYSLYVVGKNKKNALQSQPLFYEIKI